MKKFFRKFFSMPVAIVILIILAFACMLGSIIPQNNMIAWYTENYPRQISGAILMLGLDDVFHCSWFVLLAAILCLELLGCNLLHIGGLIRRTREGFSAQKAYKSFGKAPLYAVKDPAPVFAALGFRSPKETLVEVAGEDSQPQTRKALYAVKNKIGIWGPWLCHLGMLIVILGFGLGQSLKEEYAVYGVPGQTKEIWEGGYQLTIDDFETTYKDEDTVDQYTATLTMTDPKTGESQSGQASVNNPLTLFGMKLYQNSTGWAADLEVYRDEECIQTTPLCAGEYVSVADLPDLMIHLSAVYPDLTYKEGSSVPTTASGFLRNPGYLYRLYYQDSILGMNVLSGDETITIDNYKLVFTNPRPYTLIQVKRDPFTMLTAIGGLIIMISLILAFYLRTSQLLAVLRDDGQWDIFGYSKKGGTEYIDQIQKACKTAMEQS